MSFRAFLEPLSLTMLVLFSYWISHSFGGLIYFFLMNLQRLPKIGRIVDLFYNHWIKLRVLAQVFSWAVSSSGLLLGYLLHVLLWGPLRYKVDFCIILVIGCITILNHLDRMTLFEFPTFQEILQAGSDTGLFGRLGTSPAQIMAADERIAQRMARSAVADNLLPPLFRMLVSIGFVYFAAGQLRLLGPANMVPPTLMQSLSLAFSPTNLVDKPNLPFAGSIWLVIHTGAAFVTYFAFGTFIGNASSIFLEKLGSSKVQEEKKTAWDDQSTPA